MLPSVFTETFAPHFPVHGQRPHQQQQPKPETGKQHKSRRHHHHHRAEPDPATSLLLLLLLLVGNSVVDCACHDDDCDNFRNCFKLIRVLSREDVRSFWFCVCDCLRGFPNFRTESLSLAKHYLWYWKNIMNDFFAFLIGSKLIFIKIHEVARFLCHCVYSICS